MITLWTGLPGSGKTLNLISLLQNEKDRKIYYRGIQNLALPWIEVEDPRDLDQFPDGALIVVDEAADFFPALRDSSKRAWDGSQYRKHRHRGLDVYFISQHPKDFDVQIRRLCDRHVHFVRQMGMERSTRLEWNKVCETPEDKRQLKNAEKSTVKFDASVYELYKSAEVHTVKRRIPKMVYVLGGLVALLGFIAVAGFYAISDVLTPDEALAITASPYSGGSSISETPKSQESLALNHPSFSSPSKDESPASDFKFDRLSFTYSLTERVPGLPWTARIYDDMFKPNDLPRPYCLKSGQTCNCYSQQATRLAIDYPTCNYFVDHGFFDHTKLPPDPDLNRRLVEDRYRRLLERAYPSSDPPSNIYAHQQADSA